MNAPWRDCSVEDAARAEELIESHMQAALRQARFWQRVYPREDVEPIVMHALYLAAYTFRPTGDGSFYWWFQWKLKGQLCNLKHKKSRYARGLGAGGGPRTPPIRIHRLCAGAVDTRYCYRERSA